MRRNERSRDTEALSTRKYTDDDWAAICRVHDLARPDKLRGSCDACVFVLLAQVPEADNFQRSQKLTDLDSKLRLLIRNESLLCSTASVLSKSRR